MKSSKMSVHVRYLGNIMQNSGYKTVLISILLILFSFIPIACIQIDTPGYDSDSDLKMVNVTLNNGFLMVPLEGKTATILNLNPENVTEKPANAYFSGTIDRNNSVLLDGSIILDGRNETVKLSGEAHQVFIGWNVPDGAKPIEKIIGSTKVTRYEGATEKYATYLDLQDENGTFTLHGEFFEDGHGGFIGTAIIDGKECIIGLIGNSTSLYENVTPTNTTEIDPQ